MMIEVAQSVPICLALSAAGGSIEVLATAVLAYQDAKEKEGVKWTRKAHYAALALNIVLQMISSILGNLIATWFGPVSLVGPVFLSSQLLANMVVFGVILGLEMFTKDMRIGTYVVVIAVVLLPILGPTAQENQDVAALIETWYSMLWAAIQVVGMLVSSIMLVVLDVEKLQEWQAIALILSARATAFTVNLTVSKLMIVTSNHIILAIAVLLKVMSGGIITYALVVQSTAVTQAKFVPLNASALIIVNALTGMIIWEDWRVVGNWVGYICIFIQLVLGNYLLLGDVQLLSPDNTQYGRAKSVIFAKNMKRAEGFRNLFPVEETSSQESSEEELEDSSKYMDMAGGASPPVSGETEPRRRQQRRTSTAQEAWTSVYGLNNHAGGARRRQTIFVMESTFSDFERTGVL